MAMRQIEKDDQEYKDFQRYIRERLDNDGFASEYLKSGLSSDLNLGGRLTPKLFEKCFLVEKGGYEEITKKIHDLFRDNLHNMLCIEAERGSGKSTFINTMHLHLKDKKYEFEFPYSYVDMTKSKTYKYCENIVSDLFYKRLQNDIYESRDWHDAFFDTVSRVSLKNEDQNDCFIKDAWNEAIKACENKETYNAFFFQHEQRVNRVPNCDIKVFLLLYLLALATKPRRERKESEKVEKEWGWIIVFDGIEAYVTNDASDIFREVNEIHGFLEYAFDSVNLKNSFFTKFTFVLPVRTATSLSLQNTIATQNRNIWGCGNSKENIVRLPRLDFSLEALLKKLDFIYSLGISNIEDTKLFRQCKRIVSLLIPNPSIMKYLRKEIGVSEAVEKPRAFAELRLLPLLNNDHRSLVDKLCNLSIFNQDAVYDNALASVEGNINNGLCRIKYAANGINMMVLRNMFDAFRDNTLLDRIGYTAIDDLHQPGVARTMLNFLYYDEWEYRLNSRDQTQNHFGGVYPGMRFDVLLGKLKPFAKNAIQQLSLVLYRISALNAANLVESNWTNLIVIRGLKKSYNEDRFNELIYSFYRFDDEAKQEVSRCYVKLSDAGACFSGWASKQFEFLLSRCREIGTTALFTYDYCKDMNGIKAACEKVLGIIQTEGIDKLIDGCLSDCSVCVGGHGSGVNCTFENNENRFLECSLFQRYQECLFIIMECINYIDRFRLYALEVGINTNRSFRERSDIDLELLTIISQFDEKYEKLKKKVEDIFPESNKFFEKMQRITERCHRLYDKFKTTDRTSNIEAECLRRLRIPRTSLWYLDTQEEMKQAIDKARKGPTVERLYSILDAKKKE